MYSSISVSAGLIVPSRQSGDLPPNASEAGSHDPDSEAQKKLPQKLERLSFPSPSPRHHLHRFLVNSFQSDSPKHASHSGQTLLRRWPSPTKPAC
jgi:hypothetical protein